MKKEIIELFKKYGAKSATLREDGSYVVKGSLDLDDQGLTELPFKGIAYVVKGSFYCRNNQLASLSGAPTKVGWSFDCEHNQLTSLAGAPTKVGGSFWCNDNKLTSLAGAPTKVGGDFWCSNNPLTSLAGAPTTIGAPALSMG